MSTYVLVLFTWFGGYAVGATPASVGDFATKASCETARTAILDAYHKWNGGDNILAVCVAK